MVSHYDFQFENSDSEEDEEVLNDLEPIYESRNVYHLRRLPHVVGTPKFMVSIVAGCGFNLRFRSRHYSNFTEAPNFTSFFDKTLSHAGVPLLVLTKFFCLLLLKSPGE